MQILPSVSEKRKSQVEKRKKCPEEEFQEHDA